MENSAPHSTCAALKWNEGSAWFGTQPCTEPAGKRHSGRKYDLYLKQGNRLQNKAGKAEKRSKAFSFIIPFILMCTDILYFLWREHVKSWKPAEKSRSAGKIFLKGLGNKLTPIYRLRLPNISADLFHSVSVFTKWFLSKFFYFIAPSKMFHLSSLAANIQILPVWFYFSWWLHSADSRDSMFFVERHNIFLKSLHFCKGCFVYLSGFPFSFSGLIA